MRSKGIAAKEDTYFFLAVEVVALGKADKLEVG
jgi:hypothetical protein